MNSKSYLYLYLEVIKVMSCEPFLFFRYNEINYNLKHTAKPESRALIHGTNLVAVYPHQTPGSPRHSPPRC